VAYSGENCHCQQRVASASGTITEAFKVLRYELIADDGSGSRLIRFALPGREFETAEVLEAERLIKREFTDGKSTATKVLASRDTRVIIWQINTNEQDQVHGGRGRLT
jgi:hypothetical protein